MRNKRKAKMKTKINWRRALPVTFIIVFLAGLLWPAASATAAEKTFYLRNSGPTAFDLTLLETPGTATAETNTRAVKTYKDTTINSAAAFVSVGTWVYTGSLPNQAVANLGSASLWVGLANTDSKGLKAVVRVEVLKNSTVISTVESAVLTLARVPSSAVSIDLPAPSSPVYFGADDTLSLRLSAKVSLPGHASGILRLHYNRSNRASNFTINPGIGKIWAWGNHDYGQCDVPTPNSDFIAIAAGGQHSLGLKSDGTVKAWGYNGNGQCDVPTPNSGFIAIAAGFRHNLGLKSDGTVVGWGDNWAGQCNPPTPNSGFIAIAAGYYHNLGLKSDGTVVAWGWHKYGQCDVPTPNSGFIAIAAGYLHNLGLKSDGTVVAWGWNAYGERDVPTPNEGFIAIAAGYLQSLGLKSDGTVVAWGYNVNGQCDVPTPNSGFIAIAAGHLYNLGLKSDGTVVAWGYNVNGQWDVPTPNADFFAISAGDLHSLALKE
jgi:Regulator of chromosome condensation (RCC1) repeat